MTNWKSCSDWKKKAFKRKSKYKCKRFFSISRAEKEKCRLHNNNNFIAKSAVFQIVNNSYRRSVKWQRVIKQAFLVIQWLFCLFIVFLVYTEWKKRALLHTELCVNDAFAYISVRSLVMGFIDSCWMKEECTQCITVYCMYCIIYTEVYAWDCVCVLGYLFVCAYVLYVFACVVLVR